jgi:ketosteroid isomerase-like protein
MRDRDAVGAWLDGYERAWRRPGTGELGEIFTEDASYVLSPFDEPIEGLDAIAEMWEAERRGPDERLTMETKVVAVEGDVAVARIYVRYQEPVLREYRDIWIMRFASDGRCAAFEEWPFWPGQPRAAPGAA